MVKPLNLCDALTVACNCCEHNYVAKVTSGNTTNCEDSPTPGGAQQRQLLQGLDAARVAVQSRLIPGDGVPTGCRCS